MIKKGDLVMVVRAPHECAKKYIGRIYTVTNLVAARGGGWTCGNCGEMNIAGDEPVAASAVDGGFAKGNVVISWLRKIDPPSQGETREAYVNIPRKVTA